jgi:hypothetical protein
VKAFIAAAIALLTVGLAALQPAKEHEAVHLFAGTDHAWGMTADETGANLPDRFRPWRFIKSFDRSDPRFRAGRDRETLAEVDASGFSVSIVEAKIEVPPPVVR